MRHALAIGCLGVAAMLAVSCSDDKAPEKPVPSAATATSTSATAAVIAESPKTTAPSVSTTAAPPKPVVVTPDKAESVLLSTDDVGRLINATLTYQAKETSPAKLEASTGQECVALMGPNADNLGPEWTTYKSSVQSETKEKYSHYVVQTVVVYPDAKTAADAFAQAYPAKLNECKDVKVSFTAPPVTWGFDVQGLGAGPAKWAREQLNDGKPSGWRCYQEYRVKNNAIFGASVCQSGKDAPATDKIVDRMAEWIPA